MSYGARPSRRIQADNTRAGRYKSSTRPASAIWPIWFAVALVICILTALGLDSLMVAGRDPLDQAKLILLALVGQAVWFGGCFYLSTRI